VTRESQRRLEDILDAITAIRDHVGGDVSAPILGDPAVLDAVLYRLMIIGEAVKHVDAAVLAREPSVPWSQVARLRDFVTHRYFRIDPAIIEETIRRDLVPLEAAVSRLLA
jgi:uncharacterized protein with HEPN domain